MTVVCRVRLAGPSAARNSLPFRFSSATEESVLVFRNWCARLIIEDFKEDIVIDLSGVAHSSRPKPPTTQNFFETLHYYTAPILHCLRPALLLILLPFLRCNWYLYVPGKWFLASIFLYSESMLNLWPNRFLLWALLFILTTWACKLRTKYRPLKEIYCPLILYTICL